MDGKLFRDEKDEKDESLGIEGGMTYDPTWGYRSKGWLKRKARGLFYDEDITSYDYGFGQKASGWDGSAYKDYESTGAWKGYDYYRKSTVDYKYIEQMANVFSAQNNIAVRTGRVWEIDLDNKILTYSPTSLMFGTKADVVVSLLHEIGHLRYTTAFNKLILGSYLMNRAYRSSAFKVLNLFEDFRVDYLMHPSYAGAKEVEEANKLTVIKVMQAFSENRKSYVDQMGWSVQRIVNNVMDYRSNGDRQGFEYYLANGFGYFPSKTDMRSFAEKLFTMPEKEAKEWVEKIIKDIVDEPNIMDYLTAILGLAYSIDVKDYLKADVREYVELTKGQIFVAEKADSTQAVADTLEKNVFPIIEKLLKATSPESLQNAIGKGNADAMAEQAEGREYENTNPNGKSKMEVRDGGLKYGSSQLPSEWRSGDYSALRESVDSQIKELVRKLSVIKAKDLALKWNTNLRRGKLNIKDVYKYPAGSLNLFKRKALVEDRTRNFAFSILVDASGSMRSDNRSINAARGAIILAEVFDKLQIPFEITTFGIDHHRLKTYEDRFSPAVKQKVGGIATANEDATRIYKAIKKSGIWDREELNKYMIILTDGQIESPNMVMRLVEELKDKGGKTLGLDLSNGRFLERIIGRENSKNIEDANTLPNEFMELLKGIINKKLKS